MTCAYRRRSEAFGRLTSSWPGPLVFQAEEDPSVPARARDRAGDGGEGLVREALVFIALVADRHAVLDPLPFPDEPRSGDRPVLGRAAALGDITAIEFLGQGLQAFEGRRLEAAIGELLDAVGQPTFEEAPVIGRRLGFEE